MKKLTAGIFTVLIGLCAANSADAAIASKAWVEQDFATKTALNETNAEVAKKANAADVYTKDEVYTKTESDGRFDAINAAQNALTTAQSYTDAQLKTLTDQFGTSGGDGQEGTGLAGIVAGHTVQIGALETKVGGKDVATQISEALSAYTNSEDLANDYLTKTDAASTYQTLGNLADTTKEVTEAQKDTVYPSLAKTEALIGAAVTTINNDTKALGQQITTLTNGVAADVAALEAVDTELDGKISAEAQAREAADSAINTKIGTVTEGKDVVTMISEGDAATLASAKGYTDTELDKLETSLSGTSTNLTELTTRVATAEGEIDTLQGTVGDADSGLVKAATDNAAAAAAAAEQAASNAALIKANADAIALKANAADVYTKDEADNLLDDKQDNLSEDQMAAANSGITAEKVNAYETSVGVTTGISALTTGDTGTYVLTATKDTEGKVTYTWETIERAASSNP